MPENELQLAAGGAKRVYRRLMCLKCGHTKIISASSGPAECPNCHVNMSHMGYVYKN